MKALFAALVVFGGCSRVQEEAGVPAANRMEIVQTDAGFLVTEGQQRLLFYQRRPKSIDGKYTRANYIHPLCGLDGQVLTEDFPADHPHHRGIFWAWHQIYVRGRRVADGWSLKDFSCDVYDAKTLTPDSRWRALQVQVFWKSSLWTDVKGRQKPFVRETTTIRVHPTESDLRKIDFEIALLALEGDVRIGGAENAKEYGGFSARIRLPRGTEFIGPAGPVEPKNTPVEAAPWMDFSADFSGDGSVSGLAILCHKSNPGYPQRWILRRKRSMQNPVWPGRDPVLLSCEKPIVLRYRLIIHRGGVRSINVDRLEAEYNAEHH